MASVHRLVRLFGALGTAVALGSLLLPYTAANADTPRAAALSICAPDLTRLCAGIEAGNGKKMRCLLQNQAQLSPDCNQVMIERMQTRSNRLGGAEVAQIQPTPQPSAGGAATAAPAPAIEPSTAAPRLGKSRRFNKKACKVELATFCPAMAGGRTKCLIANQAKLGADCAAAIAVTQQTRQVAKAACVADAAKLCGTARGAARFQCLEINKTQLSPACLARIEKKEARQSAPLSNPATPPKQ